MKRTLLVVASCLLVSCSDGSTTTAPTTTAVTPTATPPPATPSPTPLPTATPTPAAICALSITDARFDPSRIFCPAGTSIQTVRIVFEISAGGNVPITINRVSTSGVTCRLAGGTCTWPEGSMSFSPSTAPSGTTTQIVATERFSCGGSPGGGVQQGELIIANLFVNTSCGAAREIRVTNTLSLG